MVREWVEAGTERAGAMDVTGNFGLIFQARLMGDRSFAIESGAANLTDRTPKND